MTTIYGDMDLGCCLSIIISFFFHSQFSQYLLQPVQGIVELPPAVQRQQPHLLPLADQQVDLGVLGLDGGLAGRLVHGLRGGALPCNESQERIPTYEGTQQVRGPRGPRGGTAGAGCCSKYLRLCVGHLGPPNVSETQ